MVRALLVAAVGVLLSLPSPAQTPSGPPTTIVQPQPSKTDLPGTGRATRADKPHGAAPRARDRGRHPSREQPPVPDQSR